MFETSQSFIKSPTFTLPNPEENSLPVFTTADYQDLVLPSSETDFHNLYLDIVSEINNKIKEINFAHGCYETTGMISITDTNFIKTILYLENKINRNLLDITLYKNDLSNLRIVYLQKFHKPLVNSLIQKPNLLDIEYYSNVDYYLVFSNQLINVSAHEILDLLSKEDSSKEFKIKDLLALIESIKRMINNRLSYEVSYHHLDINDIADFLNQNRDLIKEVQDKLSGTNSNS